MNLIKNLLMGIVLLVGIPCIKGMDQQPLQTITELTAQVTTLNKKKKKKKKTAAKKKIALQKLAAQTHQAAALDPALFINPSQVDVEKDLRNSPDLEDYLDNLNNLANFLVIYDLSIQRLRQAVPYLRFIHKARPSLLTPQGKEIDGFAFSHEDCESLLPDGAMIERIVHDTQNKQAIKQYDKFLEAITPQGELRVNRLISSSRAISFLINDTQDQIEFAKNPEQLERADVDWQMIETLIKSNDGDMSVVAHFNISAFAQLKLMHIKKQIHYLDCLNSEDKKCETFDQFCELNDFIEIDKFKLEDFMTTLPLKQSEVDYIKKLSFADGCAELRNRFPADLYVQHSIEEMEQEVKPAYADCVIDLVKRLPYLQDTWYTIKQLDEAQFNRDDVKILADRIEYLLTVSEPFNAAYNELYKKVYTKLRDTIKSAGRKEKNVWQTYGKYLKRNTFLFIVKNGSAMSDTYSEFASQGIIHCDDSLPTTIGLRIDDNQEQKNNALVVLDDIDEILKTFSIQSPVKGAPKKTDAKGKRQPKKPQGALTAPQTSKTASAPESLDPAAAVTPSSKPAKPANQVDPLAGYAQRIKDWFKLGSSDSYSSLLYHTFALEADPYIFTYGKRSPYINKTNGTREMVYSLYGEIIHANGKRDYVQFACTKDINGMCYHRGFRKIPIAQLMVDIYQTPDWDAFYNEQFPPLGEQPFVPGTINNNQHQPKLIDDGLTIRITDNRMHVDIILYKPIAVISLK